MSAPGMEDDPLRSDPVYPISRAAAPGGVPLDITIPGLIAIALLTVFLNPFCMVMAPIGWGLLQRWIGGDLKKPQIFVGYLGGAALSPDPTVQRPDGSQGRQWGGSTFSPLPDGPAGGTPRHVDLPED